MSEIRNRVYMNSQNAPIRKAGESDADFESRMEFFRKNDLRIVVPEKGKVNFAFDYNYTVGNGIIGMADDKPIIVMQNGEETGSVTYNPQNGGSFSIV